MKIKYCREVLSHKMPPSSSSDLLHHYRWTPVIQRNLCHAPVQPHAGEAAGGTVAVLALTREVWASNSAPSAQRPPSGDGVAAGTAGPGRGGVQTPPVTEASPPRQTAQPRQRPTDRRREARGAQRQTPTASRDVTISARTIRRIMLICIYKMPLSFS